MQPMGQVFVNTMPLNSLTNQVKKQGEWIVVDWEVCLSRDCLRDSQNLFGTTISKQVGTVIETLGVWLEQQAQSRQGLSSRLQESSWNSKPTSVILVTVDFSSIEMHSPIHGQWENARPLSKIRVDLVRDQIGLDRVQTDLVKDQVVLIRDQVNPSLLGKLRCDVIVLIQGIKRIILPWSYLGDMDNLVRDQVDLVRDQATQTRSRQMR